MEAKNYPYDILVAQHSVYIAFPFEIEDGKIHLDVPGGSIEAGVDQIPGSSNDWYTVQNFATARNAESQVVMGSQEIPLMQFGAISDYTTKDHLLYNIVYLTKKRIFCQSH